MNIFKRNTSNGSTTQTKSDTVEKVNDSNSTETSSDHQNGSETIQTPSKMDRAKIVFNKMYKKTST